MPSATHGSFIWQLGANICDNLRDLGRENEQVCDFTNSISNVLSSNLFLRDYDSTQGSTGKVEALRMSDTQFQHESATYPGVIVEVALTQDAKRLARIAKDYIYLTEEAIQVVICINLNSDNDSTISVWEATYAPLPDTDQLELFYEEVVKREGALTLYLYDFALEEFHQGIPNLSFSIPYSRVAEMLNRAEMIQLNRNAAAENEPVSRGAKGRARSPESKPEAMPGEDKL
ncbi:uncharacterized protein BKA55DRAFT_546223 [Fusarium redolens]|uniref:Uncharacterized protein n=1 Tax=Fusarium redolens TaxID=48865 RepID=A0A9P9FXW6_FUSRE|nr:uncharacterized protein BKA55DRAFT_546223 [Fusarium redolens]KAH7220441.1 hypothetical protein BKA55DRAFT_546223 [Fusarium redolens]